MLKKTVNYKEKDAINIAPADRHAKQNLCGSYARTQGTPRSLLLLTQDQHGTRTGLSILALFSFSLSESGA